MKVMNGLDLQSQKIVNVADPSTATDAANRQYVDNVARGSKWKDPVRAASTTNVTIATPGASLDGVTLAVNDRVLLKNQTAGAENGIYVWTASGAALTRATDADTTGELAPGTAVLVTEGSVNQDKSYIITSNAAITIGTTTMTWGEFGGGQTYAAGNGLSAAGNTFSVNPVANGGLLVGGSGAQVDPAIVARKYSVNVGNGSNTSIALSHNLGTKDVHVSVRQVSDDSGVLVDWVATDNNTVTLTFAVAPAASAYRATIIA